MIEQATFGRRERSATLQPILVKVDTKLVRARPTEDRLDLEGDCVERRIQPTVIGRIADDPVDTHDHPFLSSYIDGSPWVSRRVLALHENRITLFEFAS
jgi:hypothetical protein